MREFIEDALQHQQDGYGRAQKHVQRQLPRRFYKQAEVAAVDGGYAVTLDERRTRTPGQVPVVVPVEALANAMAAEWAAQGEKIDPLTMPVVRLINSALEGGVDAEQAMRQEIMKYVATDMLLYRADSPRELAAAQEEAWDAMLVALARHFTTRFQPTVGIVFQAQPEDTLARIGGAIADAGYLELTALVSITNLTGSGLTAIGLKCGLFDGDAAWHAAHIDEDHNIRLWGDDPEASARRARRRVEFDAALDVMMLLHS